MYRVSQRISARARVCACVGRASLCASDGTELPAASLRARPFLHRLFLLDDTKITRNIPLLSGIVICDLIEFHRDLGSVLAHMRVSARRYIGIALISAQLIP